MESRRFTVEEAILADILNFLQKRPYSEVHKLITNLQADATLVVKEPVKVETPKLPEVGPVEVPPTQEQQPA